MIDKLIIAIDEAGLRLDAYGVVNTVALIIALIIGVWHNFKLKIGIIANVVIIATYYILPGYIATAIIYIEDGFTKTGRQNGVYFFAFVPLIGFLIALAVKKSYKQIWDAFMVIPLMRFAGARVACTITGCCRGYPFKLGVYNPVVDEKLFPIQLLEAFVSILIVAYVFWREKKNNFVPDGKNVPIILISYGISRFFLEFLHDNGQVFWGMDHMHFHCVLMILVGIVAAKILNKQKTLTLPNTVPSTVENIGE